MGCLIAASKCVTVSTQRKASGLCDHVYFGYSDALPQANPLEVQNYKYIGLNELQEELLENADNYSEWLKICLDQLINYQRNHQRSA